MIIDTKFRRSLRFPIVHAPLRSCILRAMTSVALSLALGCGGAVSSTPSSSEGPLATCGANCSASEVLASCSDICGKVAQTGCSVDAECPMDCATLPSMAPSCAALVVTFLRCVESSPVGCDAGMVQFAACNSQEQAVTACIADSGASMTATSSTGPSSEPPVPPGGPPTGPLGGPCAGVAADVCPAIPRPAGAGASACSGGGGGAANGTTISQVTCQDGSGNVWQSECAGSTCTCTYNGGQACTCSVPAQSTCSCCPGDALP
jgi:hypothetical protein